MGYGLYKEFQTRGLPEEMVDHMDMSLFMQDPLNIEALDQCDSGLISRWERIRQQQETDGQALIVLHLAQSLDVSIQDLLKSTPDTLETLLDWVSSSQNRSTDPSGSRPLNPAT